MRRIGVLDNRPVFVGVWLPPVENMRDKPVPQEPNDEPIIISGGCAPRCIELALPRGLEPLFSP